MKIVVLDYDGVIADTNQLKSEWIATTLGVNVPPSRCDRTQCVPGIGLSNYEKMSEYVYDRKASLLAKPVPGSIRGIAQLSQQSRLFIVTARTKERIKWAEEWLSQNGMADKFDDIISSNGRAKGDLVSRLEASAMVDDDERHLRGLEQYEFQKYHFAPFMKKRYLHMPGADIVRVRNWRTLLLFISGHP